jgi:hypothetical protein
MTHDTTPTPIADPCEECGRSTALGGGLFCNRSWGLVKTPTGNWKETFYCWECSGDDQEP